MKTSLTLRTQVATILILVALWFVTFVVTLFGNQMSWYIAPFQALVVILPVVLPILGLTLIAEESSQRSQHPFLLYGGAAASILPTFVGTIWIYVTAYSPN